MKLKEGLLEQPDMTGHEILQMCREVCNLYLFFMKIIKFQLNRILWNGLIREWNFVPLQERSCTTS